MHSATRIPRRAVLVLARAFPYMVRAWGAGCLDADASAVIESVWSTRDFELRLDPEGDDWREAPRVTASRDYLGKPIAGPPTEIRSRWTNANLYLLFVNPYDE